jgi:uncharacterized repeat protein (TIGR03806 family)
MRHRRLRVRSTVLAPLVALAFALTACGEDASSDTAPRRPSFDASAVPLERLSDYGFFHGPLVAMTPAPSVVPYTPISPLWADHAAKGRYVYLPEGAAIAFTDDEDWAFPIGTVVIKTFYLDLDRADTQTGAYRVMETRLLVMEEDGWSAHTYVWNDAQTDAVRQIAGGRVEVDVVDETGAAVTQIYQVPSTNDCNSCHERSDELRTLGLVTQQLDFDIALDGTTTNQLAYLADQGLFDTQAPTTATPSPLVDPADPTASLDARARSYLHANCGHCHRSGGGGGRSGLSLLAWEHDPARYGVCKTPVAAGAGTGGRGYDIVPGNPGASIIPYRMAATDPEIRMPELPSRIVDDFGVTLIQDWIAAMPEQPCE